MKDKINLGNFFLRSSVLARSITVIMTGLSLSLSINTKASDEPQPAGTEVQQLNADVYDVKQLDTIVVTTRRREEKAQDVPTPISILSGQTLESQRLSRVEDLQQALPSLNVAFQNPRQSSVAIRGLGNNPASDGLEASVGVYLDNVYLGRPGMVVFDILDVAQLELLRGPQGTLFGKNTTAGLLNITSKAPTFYPDNTLEISAGERNYFQAKGSLSDALTETVAGRFSFYKTVQDGFIENVAQPNADKLNDIDRQGVRGQILWQPSDHFNLRWIADYHEEDDQQGTTLLYSIGPTFNHAVYGENYNRYLDNATQAGAQDANLSYKDLKISSDSPKRMQVDQGGTSVEANWTLDSGKKLTSITAYRFWNFTPTNNDNISADAIRNNGVSVEDEQYSQELRLSSAKSDRFDWVTGLYYFQQNLENHNYSIYGNQADAFILYQNAAARSDIASGTANILNNRETHTYGYADTKSYAAFGQGTWHTTPKLDITAGGRVTYEEKEARVNRLAPIGGVNTDYQTLLNNQIGAYDSGKLNLSDTSYSGLLTASYKINPNNLFYATYSHGEKSGGFNLAVGTAPSAGADSLKVDPEIADNYEIGLKQTLWNNRLQLNSNLFWVDVKDYQTTGTQQIGTNYVSVLDNAGKVRSRGAEIDATIRPIPGLTVNVNGSWNDAKYTKYEGAPAPSSVSIPTGVAYQDLTGQRVYGVPEWIANVNFRYDLKSKNKWQPYVAGSYSWRDWSYGNLDNAKESIIDAYGLFNASVGTRYNIGENQLDVSLWAKNLTDKIYVTNVNNGSSGILNATLGQPRTVGATLKLSF
ncbi:TonB-dependent receptor [Acinetobacter populi]|uniref:TonB-dependent receptor n=1 Tax=Acinetobacter populi TaxID=1582270 RepID=A0A1Z9Z0A2_9GAMM|nr:TonB-dependent receptor [Acinetobacter populi]OUY07862.1 TonB-dependent receptor [Acinetobacter populi]